MRQFRPCGQLHGPRSLGNRIPPGLRVAPESSRASFGLPEICSFHPGLVTKKISHWVFIEDRRKNRPPLTCIDPEVASFFAEYTFPSRESVVSLVHLYDHPHPGVDTAFPTGHS